MLAAGFTGARRLERRPPRLGRLPHRQERVAGDDQVELLAVDDVFLPDHDRDEEDAEDVAAVALELRTRLVVVLRGREKLLERALVHVGREVACHLCRRRIEQVDPLVARGGHSPRA